MFAITFPSHTTVREEIGCLERLQVMPLDLTLTHSAFGGLQAWIPGFSRALLSSAAHNSLRLTVIFRTGGQINVVIYGKPFLQMGGFPARKVSNTATSSVLLFHCSCTDLSGTVGSLLLSLLTPVLRRVLQDPSVTVAIQAHAMATCNHFESKWFHWGLL